MELAMLRFFVRFLLFVLAVVLIGLAVGPLLVNPNPAPGATSAKTLAGDDSRFVAVPYQGTDGISLHYLARPAGNSDAVSAGDAAAAGRVFVLLHGFTFNAYTWSELLDFFAGHGRVLAYDQIPYGLSAKLVPGSWEGPNPYAKAAAVEQLFAFMDARNIGRAVLVGNSSGGTLALEAALARPERVEALILIGPWVHSKRPIFPQWVADLPQLGRISLQLARYLGGDMPLLDHSYADPSLIDDHRRALTGIHRGMANWDVAWGALLNHSLTDPVEISAHLGEIEQPALVIIGGEDRIVPVEDTAATARALPDAHFALLPGCGHLPQEECPAMVEQVVGEWLETLEDGAR
ncbi:MAG: alpha/beta hydrolase [Thiohalocapsa sp.]|nr:alpha/beta hydrolase [Thiohalocapsa sp.]